MDGAPTACSCIRVLRKCRSCTIALRPWDLKANCAGFTVNKDFTIMNDFDLQKLLKCSMFCGCRQNLKSNLRFKLPEVPVVQKVSRDDVEIRHGGKLFAVVKRRNLGSHSCRFSALVSSATGRPVLRHQAHLHDASACPLPEWRGMKQNVCERRFYNVTCMFFLMDGLRWVEAGYHYFPTVSSILHKKQDVERIFEIQGEGFSAQLQRAQRFKSNMSKLMN